MQAIRDEILSGAEGLCPLCGRGSAVSLDHFLPRSKFPELTVFSLNLVPCCNRCNMLKGDQFRRHDGARFLHAYFDALPDEEILCAHIYTDQSVIVEFDVQTVEYIDAAMLSNVQFHFEQLHLRDYYQTEATIELFDKLDALCEYYSVGGAEEVQAYLQIEYSSVKARRGKNYWRTALFAALSRSEDFCDGGFKLLL